MYVSEIILACILGVISILLIISVLKQKGTTEGLGSILGGSNTDNFLGRNKAVKTKEGRLALMTKICVILIVVLAIALAIMLSISELRAAAA